MDSPTINRTESVMSSSNSEVLLGNKYKVSRTALGQGAFGAVVIGKSVDDPPSTYAIKKIPIAVMLRNPEEELQRHVKTEIGIMRIIRHPNIVTLEDAFYSDHNLYLVLEYCKGGDFFALISPDPDTGEGGGPLPCAVARKYFQQLIGGVEYCHERGIAHRDLKPENLLLDEHHNLKICDFGLSTIKREAAKRVTQTQCGTPNYVAPEILHTDGIYSDEYDPYCADVWTCGILLYVFLTACLPFDHANLQYLYTLIKKANLSWPQDVSVPKGARTLTAKILDPNPETRMTIAHMREDEWFKVGLDQANPNIPPSPVHSVVPMRDDGAVNAFELIGQLGAFSGLMSSEQGGKARKFTTPAAAEQFEPMLLQLLADKFGAVVVATEVGDNGIESKTCECSVASDNGPGELRFEVKVLKILDECCVTSLKLQAGDELVFYNDFYVALCHILGPEKVQGELPQKREAVDQM